MLLNIHIYPSPIKNESRILNITKTLADNRIFDTILIIGVFEEGVSESESLDKYRQILRFPRKLFNGRTGLAVKFLKNFEWCCRVIRSLGNRKADCINCHSLSVLPACVILKYLCGAKLIYDTHELETESAGSNGIRKIFSKIIERSFIGFSDVVIVVSESISEWYKKTYHLATVPVIRNFPDNPKTYPMVKNDYLRRKYGIDEDAILFLYLGILAAGRGVDILLDAFSRARSKDHMVFMGYGILEDKVKDYEQRFCNIHFHPAVSPEEISQHISGADVGVSLIENICLSYYYCLPNKLFMYLSDGLPVIVSDFPEMEKIIKEDGCGWSVRVNAEAITGLLNAITREDIDRKRENAIRSRMKYDWSGEEKVLLDTYANLFASNS